RYNMDNTIDGLYIAPAFMDKLVVHITKNYLSLPSVKIPLILGIWGGKGQGKSFQCELVFAKMGISPIMMSAGELESGNAGEPAKLIRQRYREAADIIKKGKMCCLFINDLDAGAGRLGGTTQYTVNNQMVNATLMNIADNPTNVQLPGMYNKEDNPRVPIIVTGNDFSTLYAPLIRDGRMEKFYWAPTREDRIGVCQGIFRSDGVPKDDVVKLVDTFPGQSIDFFGALRARVYDDEVRNWISGIGVESIGKRLVNSKEGPPTFEQPKMTIDKLLEYGNMLVQEQDNVKRVQLADKYLSEAALGDANDDAIKTGNFYGQGAQQVNFPVQQGCADPYAENYDPTARSDNGSCTYNFFCLDSWLMILLVSSQPDQLLYVGFEGLRSDNLTLTNSTDAKGFSFSFLFAPRYCPFAVEFNNCPRLMILGTSIKPVMELTSMTRCAILLQQQSSTNQDFNLKSEKLVLA
ncbi:ribulose bisphosphate carboxylase/oxygenase activase, partial [Trifolium pratense]